VTLSVADYWKGQLAALRKRSVEVEPTLEASEAWPNGWILPDPDDPSFGIIDVRIWFDDQAFLDVYEHVRVDSYGRPHREHYSYHLEVDGIEVLRHDFDPDLDDALQHHVHEERRGHTLHIPSPRITLVYLVEQCWGLIEDCRR
jgi:hypothetical protein